MINFISDDDLTKNTTGSGIFDQTIISQLKNINDPYPYFRGLISEISGEVKTIEFEQPLRKKVQQKIIFLHYMILKYLALLNIQENLCDF